MARPLITRARTIEKRNWKSIRGILQRVTALETASAGHLDGRFDKCRVYHDTTQSVGLGAFRWVNFNSTDFDLNGLHNDSVDNTRITIPTTGYYMAGCNIRWASGIGYRQTEIYINRTTIIAFDQDFVDTTANFAHTLSTPFLLTAGQYLEVRCFQDDSGGALNISQYGNASPTFWAFRIE